MHLFLVGAGHVGLVTAAGFAKLGHRVTVADIDEARIAALTEGRPPVYEPGLDAALSAYARQGRLRFTTDLRPPDDAAISIVCVSTPTGPDGPLSTANVEAAVRGLLGTVGPEHTIVVRSTLPVDGPHRLLALVDGPPRPRLVTNPEFMREGSALADFENPSRVVTGWLEPSDREAAEAVAELYAPLHAPTMIADAGSVALIKLASNVFLAAKVAFANELARICDAVGADVDTVAAGIGMDGRIGRAFLSAGPGYGGSCLPEQAVALALQTHERGVPTPLIDAVSRSNETHQRAIVRRLQGLLGGGLEGRRIALLGLAFKAETDDVRESPALALAAYLREAGAEVTGYDPRAAEKARRADPALGVRETIAEALDGADAVLVTTEWREFATLDWSSLAACLRGDLVYDLRNIVVGQQVREAGLRHESLGRH
ncbi:MAG TPA: UDP-glucose/GDP-mannose dehydrogenase family protein [Candidatus Limnocylindrales bacterium]|nr:UDP-glucose/GDP-mannose dehydrogenase family protein [Candidatus Limnocylindrales bacterium]